MKISKINESGSVTKAICDFIESADTIAAGPVVADRAMASIIDTVGCILAGANSEMWEPLEAYVKLHPRGGSDTIAGTALTTTPEIAAMVHGSFGHALDFDDVLSMMPAHPSSVILPALWAVAEPSVSGAEIIDAFIVGIEVGGRIGLGMSNAHYRRGFHSTGTLAIFSALAALARLLKCDGGVTANAFGIAGSMASGLRCNFGTMTKPFHAGWAAHNAVVAMQLARAGMTASPSVFDVEAGFVDAYGTEQSDMSRTTAALGRPWVFESPGLALKKYPCIYALHRPIDALLALRAKYGLTLENTELIECRVAPGVFRPLLKKKAETGLEAKFSMDYVLAVAAVDGVYNLATFTDAAVARPQIEQALTKVKGIEDPRCMGDEADPKSRSAGTLGFVEVTVRTKDGRGETMRVDKPSGSPEKPLTWDDLDAKFLSCADFAGLPEQQAKSALAAWRGLPAAPSLPPLLRILAKGAE